MAEFIQIGWWVKHGASKNVGNKVNHGNALHGPGRTSPQPHSLCSQFQQNTTSCFYSFSHFTQTAVVFYLCSKVALFSSELKLNVRGGAELLWKMIEHKQKMAEQNYIYILFYFFFLIGSKMSFWLSYASCFTYLVWFLLLP